MGMFDKPEYLTGKDGKGYVQTGDTFWLHNARIDGVSTVGGQSRPKAKLLVSHTRDGDKSVVFTSGAGIVNMVSRMDSEDRKAFPVEVRLDSLPPTAPGNNPTNILTPADQPEPDGFVGGDEADIPF
jgi:hypothetical protein